MLIYRMDDETFRIDWGIKILLKSLKLQLISIFCFYTMAER